ncbi:hypothetical protein SAMN02910357_01896 [Succinivibrio dextrinosolvens]|uniref:hypothetical protein n=1 Tax=Succinivibrio dextrinosolvens TaxID=83771 RepID=UPI0008F0B926|nr:hypothetical protein [Succinivibrio dextrinosolvens]SFS79758.1 hypothetical protein SAMN02910357_01896 [Succinivibrio dextrinosolvens]
MGKGAELPEGSEESEKSEESVLSTGSAASEEISVALKAPELSDVSIESATSAVLSEADTEISSNAESTASEPAKRELTDKSFALSDNKQLSSENNGSDLFELPKNSGPVFNSPMDGSDIKNVTHNNSSELSLLISALEEQQKRTVTTLRTDNSEYTRKLDEIFNPTVLTSEIVPQKETLNTSNLFNEKFQNARSVIDSKLDIVLDTEKYLNELRDSVSKLTSDGDSQVSSDVSRSIEGISSIVADLTSTKNTSSDLKSALAKLPSFDESGNIVSAAPIDEKKATEDNDDKDEVPFELTPQSEELSVDEAFAQAQKEALAQLEQDKELESQLKEDAQRFNQALRDSSISIEAVINPESAPQDKSDLLANEDDHYIQNIEIQNSDDSDVSFEGQPVSELNSESSEKAGILTAEQAAPKVETVSDLKPGIAVTYVAGFFEGNTKEVTEIIPDKLESLALVLSEVERNSSDVFEHKLSSLDNEISGSVLPPSLQQAVDSALCGTFGQNTNAASENGSVVQTVLSLAKDTNITEATVKVVPDSVYAAEISSGTPTLDSGFTPVVDDDDADDDSHIETVRVSDLKAVDSSNTTEADSNLIDGNPKIVRESTLKLIEAERQFENRRLGRKLEPKDFYYKVEETDPWFQTILKSGYNDGPVFSALCYSKRIIDPNDQYKWKLQISTDFELMTSAPDFHHNLRTRFSFVLNHPVEIELESFKGVPPGCPEELARMWFIKEIENAKYEISQNEELNTLLMKLGEDLRTLNISIYTQNGIADMT